METSNSHPNDALKSRSRTVEEPYDGPVNQVILMGQKSGSSELQAYITYYGVPLRLQLNTFYRKTNWTHFTGLQYTVEMFHELMKLEMSIRPF